MNFEQARFNMVEQQVRTWDVLDSSVLDLMMTIKREEFVPARYRDLAFADTEIPLGHGQTMLKPVIEGRIMQAVQVAKTDSVLEIGTGSGYLTALLAARGEWVRSMEIVPELVDFAHANLERAGISNVIVEEGDGMGGWPSRAPYDVIVLGGSVPVVPDALLQQLKVGGRMFAVVGAAPAQKACLITCVAEGQFRTEDIFETCLPALSNVPQPDPFRF